MKNLEPFMIRITFLLTIHLSKKAPIGFLPAQNNKITVKYFHYIEVLLHKNSAFLLEINNLN